MLTLRTKAIALGFLLLAASASAQTAIPGGGIWMPYPPTEISGSASFATVGTLDAAGESFAWIFAAPKTGNIRSCSFKTGTVTFGGTSNLDIRLETVSATDGFPTGTLVAANTNASHDLGDGDDTIWIKGTNFTAVAPVVRGTLYACVVVTVTGATESNFVIQGFNDDGGYSVGIPYTALKTGGTYAFNSTTTGSVSLFAPEYDDGTYEYIAGTWPFETAGVHTYNSTTASIDERGMNFKLPITVQVGGAWVWGGMTAAGGASLIFYEGLTGTSAISDGTCVFDVDQVALTGDNLLFCRLPADITLTANTEYVLAWKPAGATNISLQEFDVDTGVGAALMNAFPGGADWRFTSRVDDGANWAAVTTTSRPFMGIRITGVTTTGSSGGHIIGGN